MKTQLDQIAGKNHWLRNRIGCKPGFRDYYPCTIEKVGSG